MHKTVLKYRMKIDAVSAQSHSVFTIYACMSGQLQHSIEKRELTFKNDSKRNEIKWYFKYIGIQWSCEVLCWAESGHKLAQNSERISTGIRQMNNK